MEKSTGLYVGRNPKNFKNIPDHGFKIVEQSTERMVLRVEAFREGKITLSPFSAIQILEGAEHMPELQNIEGKYIAKEMFHIYVKLNSAFRKIHLMGSVPDKMEFQITRKELLTLIQWLKFRMGHCETERDQRTMVEDPSGVQREKFNADTYIGQKLLLLELLNLAMGVITD